MQRVFSTVLSYLVVAGLGLLAEPVALAQHVRSEGPEHTEFVTGDLFSWVDYTVGTGRYYVDANGKVKDWIGLGDPPVGMLRDFHIKVGEMSSADEDAEQVWGECDSIRFVSDQPTEFKFLGVIRKEECCFATWVLEDGEDPPVVRTEVVFSLGVMTDDADSRWSWKERREAYLTINGEETFTKQDRLPGSHPKGERALVPFEQVSADSDDDGLSYEDELAYGTDPSCPDTDADGLGDGDEVYVWGTDPTIASTDGDGLTDGEEVHDFGTDPLDYDTDDDGLSDSEEVGMGTDPLASDTDGDGLSDKEELIWHTDPTNPDSDGDGVSDGDEVAAGSDPLDPTEA